MDFGEHQFQFEHYAVGIDRQFGQHNILCARACIRSRGPAADHPTATLASTVTVTSYRLYQTSVSVTLGLNGNSAGTNVSISTGNFNVWASSAGSGAQTLFIANLLYNTTYTVQARAVNYQGLPSSATLVVGTTATLADVPGVSSFSAVNVTSATLWWLPGQNPLTPPTSYAVEISTWEDSTGLSQVCDVQLVCDYHRPTGGRAIISRARTTGSGARRRTTQRYPL